MKKRVYDKFPLPDDQTKKMIDNGVKTGTVVVGAILIWEITKWTVAALSAPVTGGGSLALAATIP